jgi:hypothetical protein
MIRALLLFFAGLSGLLITSCNEPSPESYFSIAVLNCNSVHGFAAHGLQRELENPSMKMTGGDQNNFSPMKRKEILDNKIQNIDANLACLKQLKETTETRELISASKALYEYVLPVYENEYRELVRLYDDEASAESISSYAQLIHHRYYAGYVELIDKLVDAGKPFAEKHHIDVNWDVRTSP